MVDDGGRIADHFLVVGPSCDWELNHDNVSQLEDISPSDTDESVFPSLSFEPVVQDRYPGKDALPVQTEKFCLPAGVKVRSCPVRREVVFAALNDPQLASRHRDLLPHFFSFVLTNRDATSMYGAVLQFWDVLPPEAEDRLRRKIAHARGESSSEAEDAKSPKELLRRIGKSRVLVTRALVILSRYPYYATFTEFLLFLYRSLPEASYPVERIVGWFLDLNVPSSGVSLMVPLGGRKHRVERMGISSFPVLDLPVHLVFQALRPEMLLLLFNAVLLERKILIISTHKVLLNYVIETVCALIFPLRWLHLRIPILPNWKRFRKFLCAPVPFIMGTGSDWLRRDSLPHDLVIIDIDSSTAFLPESTLPSLPKAAAHKLLSRLKHLLHPFDLSKGDGMQYDIPVAVSATTRVDPVVGLEEMRKRLDEGGNKLPATHPTFPKKEIQMKFFRFFLSILKNYKAHFAETSDGETSFNETSFLSTVPPDDRAFFAEFVGTQIFMSSLILERTDSRGGLRHSVAVFDAALRERSKRSLFSRRSSEQSLTSLISTSNEGSARTMLIPAVSRAGLPSDAVYRYDFFPKLDLQKFQQNPAATQPVHPRRPPASLSWSNILTLLRSLEAERRRTTHSRPRWLGHSLRNRASGLIIHSPSPASQATSSDTESSFARNRSGSMSSITHCHDLPSPSTSQWAGGSSCNSLRSHLTGIRSPPRLPDEPSGSVISPISQHNARQETTSDPSSWGTTPGGDDDNTRNETTPSQSRMTPIPGNITPSVEGDTASVIEGGTMTVDMHGNFRLVSDTHRLLITFDCSVMCPQCSLNIGEPSVLSNMTGGLHDYKTKCERCSERFVPNFNVTVVKWLSTGALSTCSILGDDDTTTPGILSPVVSPIPPSTPNVISSRSSSESCGAYPSPNTVLNTRIPFLSPEHLQKEVNNLIQRLVVADENLLRNHPTTFWNLLRNFRWARVTMDMLLPQVSWCSVAAILCNPHPTPSS